MQPNFWLLILISLGFLLLFTAFSTAQNLTTKILEDNDFGKLGFYALAVLYCTFGCFSFLSAPIVTYLGNKLSLFIGAMCYVVYNAIFILPLMRSQHPDN
jgi:fluoride ion exporter CrcB/FEX